MDLINTYLYSNSFRMPHRHAADHEKQSCGTRIMGIYDSYFVVAVIRLDTCSNALNLFTQK